MVHSPVPSIGSTQDYLVRAGASRSLQHRLAVQVKCIRVHVLVRRPDRRMMAAERDGESICQHVLPTQVSGLGKDLSFGKPKHRSFTCSRGAAALFLDRSRHPLSVHCNHQRRHLPNFREMQSLPSWTTWSTKGNRG